MTERIESFGDLRVYQAAFELQQEVFKVSKAFPKEEMFSLTDQIRRSSRAIGANLAEAWQKRRYEAHFVSKLSDSDAEQAETQHWLDTASTNPHPSAANFQNDPPSSVLGPRSSVVCPPGLAPPPLQREARHHLPLADQRPQ